MFGELRPVDGGSPILLEKRFITVGQDRTCDVVIEHPSVSASHCHMEFRDGHWFIEDLGSRNGIGVNGEKVESAWVPAASVINIGTLEFDFQYSSVASTTEVQEQNTPAFLSKLDRVLKSIKPQRDHRIQVRAGQPLSPEILKTSIGMLKAGVDGSLIPLLYEELYVGRDNEVDIVLPFLAVAKTHCVLRFRDGNWLVRDLNNNGVTINGQSVTEGRLLPGAILGVATQEFQITYSQLAETVSSQTLQLGYDSELPGAEDESQELNPDEFEIDDPEVDDELNANEITVLGMNEEQNLGEVDSSFVGMRLAIEDLFPQADAPLELRTVESSNDLATSSPAPVIQKLLPARTPIDDRSQTARSVISVAKQAAVQQPKVRSIEHPVARASAISDEQWLELIQCKYKQIQQFLKDRTFGGLLLTRPANIAWATCGVDVPCGSDGQPSAALLMTPGSQILLARKTDADLFLHGAIPNIGFEFRDCDRWRSVSELSQSFETKTLLACDQPMDSYSDASADVAAMRLPLSQHEIVQLRLLGIRVARAVEKAARDFRRGDTEAQIAGDVASRLIRHEVVPERIQVWGDGRAQNWQNWNYGRAPVERDCTISVVARRRGLHVAISRTVSFGILSKEHRWAFADMSLAHATAMFCSRDQAEQSTVWSQVEQAYNKLGNTADWRATDPGCVTGYELCESPISPTSRLRLCAGMPLIWRSVIGSARAVDTVLIRESDCKVITQTGEWPQSSFVFDNVRLLVPAVLQRNS